MRIVDIPICGIACDSRLVKKGFVFVAIKGNRQDGRKFIRQAIEKGASLIVAEGRIPAITRHRGAVFLSVKDARKFLSDTCARFYGRAAQKIEITGITGTNGKTTISYLIEALLKEDKKDCGVIGTINYRFKNKIIPAKNTTPGPVELHAILAAMSKAGTGHCCMEVSSHALDQERVEGIKFSRAIFTNLTLDHLDYHKNLENYFQAKARLFRGLEKSAFAIINNDDKYARRIKKLTGAKVITYGIKRVSAVMAKNIQSGIGGMEFILTIPVSKIKIKSPLVGRHNLYNLLSAAAWAFSCGINIRVIKKALEDFSVVPGRLEQIKNNSGFTVFVDYAHTPDALANVISALKPLTEGKIIVVFGCGGERDKTKRPKMGRIATELADFAIITSDNPRSETPLKIIEDIKRGIIKNNYCLIPDRRQAIKAGLKMARKGDILLVAGKGHEGYQVIKDKVLRFNDREVIGECLK